MLVIILCAALAGILGFILCLILIKNKEYDRYARKVMSNLTEERKNYEATAHWYKSILDAIPLSISVTDANACWTFVNTHVENFLGVKFEDIKGKPCSNWSAHICNTPYCGIECAKNGIKQTFFRQNNLSYKVDIEVLKDIEGKTAGYIEIVQDITQMEKLAHRHLEAEAVSKTKSAFIATMSHEIRTPLNAILGITDIQIQDKTLSQSVKDALIKIYSSGDLLLNIINDILDLSKIEAGKLELFPVDYDVSSLINDTVHLNITRINNKPIKFELEIDKNIPLALYGDEIRIKQILNNLLSNAFKYTERGNVVLSVNAEINAGKEFDTIMIFTVSDTGQGMTPEEVNGMFNEYSRFNMETNRTTEGTGLGMSITKHLIYLMNGEINVKSVPEEGTTFTVRIPQKRIDTEIIGSELADSLKKFNFDNSPLLKKSQITREPMPYGSVLVVDDVETNLYVARGLLASYDLKVEIATSGFEAIDKIRDGKIYDIIFMDHMMPKMDGFRATKLIRDSGYTHSIVALTANAVVGQSELFLNNGFDDFVSKPIDIRQLNTLLNRLIRDKQPQEVIDKARQTGSGNERHDIITSELAKIFTRDADKTISVLETTIKNKLENDEDVQNYIIHVHSMKSALANIGEIDASMIAFKLEKAGREGNIGLLLNETNKFVESLKAITEKIKPKENIKPDENNEIAQDVAAFLHEKLNTLLGACASYDKKAAKKTLYELEGKPLPQEIRNTFEKISEHLLHSEFEDAVKLASELIKRRV